MLEGVGGLVPEGGEVGVLLAGERAVVLVLLRLAADDQDGLALDVEPGVVVVVELLGVVLGGDAIAGEDDRHAFERAAAADRQGDEVVLGFGLQSPVASGPVRLRARSGPSVGLPLSGERLKIPLEPRGRLEPGLLECSPRDTRRPPRSPSSPAPALAGVVGQEGDVTLQPRFGRACDMLRRDRPGRRNGQAPRSSRPWPEISSVCCHLMSASNDFLGTLGRTTNCDIDCEHCDSQTFRPTRQASPCEFLSRTAALRSPMSPDRVSFRSDWSLTSGVPEMLVNERAESWDRMAVKHLNLERFTVFDQISIDFTSGINVFLGGNSTGKSHLMKLIYSLLRAWWEIDKDLGGNSTKSVAQIFSEGLKSKLAGVFHPVDRNVGRLVRRSRGRSSAEVDLAVGRTKLQARLIPQQHFLQLYEA